MYRLGGQLTHTSTATLMLLPAPAVMVGDPAVNCHTLALLAANHEKRCPGKRVHVLEA